MIIALEVTCPDSPRSVDLDELRAAIVDAAADLFDGVEIYVQIESGTGRWFELVADVGCVQELEPESARAAGFTIDPTEV